MKVTLPLCVLLWLGFVSFSIAGCQTSTENEGSATKDGNSNTIVLKSLDDLSVTADVYTDDDTARPFIVLCHQAGWSRGEYLEIAPKLNELGFNCMAIDQRSGNETNGVANLTVKAAKLDGKPTEFVDAEQDIVAAVKHVRDSNMATGKVILLSLIHI